MRKSVLIFSILTLVLSCNPVTERMDRFEVHGIDVSHYQSKIDWSTVARQDIAFAFVKATEGETLKDSLYQSNWSAIKSVGIRRGAYHFFRPTVSATKQARHFIKQVDLQPGDLPPVLDIEVVDGVSETELIAGARKWLNIIEKKYRIKPIIYTNLKYYHQHLAAHFENYPIWIARYNKYNPELGNGNDWKFWQYGNRGKLEGIDGFVDFNVFNGTTEELNELTLKLPQSPKRKPSFSFVW